MPNVITPAGVPSAKHSKGRTWKRHIRIEKVAQLSKDALYTNEQIANFLGVHVQTIIAIKATGEFQAKMMELATGIICDLDKDLRTTKEALQEEMASMVPMALLAVRQAILSKNPNIALKASLEVLDREGTNAKVSKVTVQHETKPDMSKLGSQTFDIMALLGRPVGAEAGSDVAGGFTVTADQATTQVRNMSEQIDEKTLAELDLSDLKKQ